MNPDLAEVLEQLNVERYSRSMWWSRETFPAASLDDSDGACARRRAAMVADFDRVASEVVA